MESWDAPRSDDDDDDDDDVSICFDDDKYNSEDENRMCWDEIEELGEFGEITVSARERDIYYMSKTPGAQIEFCIGMKFADHKELRHAVKCQAIANGYSINFEKSEKNRVLAICKQKEMCKWRLWATSMKTEDSFQIKSLVNNHTCVRSHDAYMVDSTWLAKEYGQRFSDNPKWRLKDMQLEVNEKLGLMVSTSQCWRAKKKAIGEIKVDLIKHYKLLYDYAEEIMKTHPGSRIAIDYTTTEVGDKIFKRLYVCFSGIKRARKEHCRHVIGLDGCFLKGRCKGELLSAIGRDANNQIFPICWAVVEGENTNSWTWFVEHMMMDIGPDGVFSTGKGWTIISDQQKGLLQAINRLLPDAEHRNCARHIYANFSNRFKGTLYRKYFWKATKSSTREEFSKVMTKVKNLSITAYDWLIAHDPNVWSKAFFECTTKCVNVDNNMSEVFNGSITIAREKLIIDMLEDIRQALLNRMMKNVPNVLKNAVDLLCPNIRKKLEDNRTQYRFWSVRHNMQKKYEISLEKDIAYIVDMQQYTCSCRMWQLSGIPCLHSISAIYHLNVNPDNFVDKVYFKYTYKATYENMLETMSGRQMWPSSTVPPCLPPADVRMPGRPKKARRKEWHEEKAGSSTVLSKKGVQMKCSNYGIAGHNKRGCNEPVKEVLVEVGDKPKNKGGRPRKENSDAATQAKPKKKKKKIGMGEGYYVDPSTGNEYLNVIFKFI
ncbi:uncharacterized protein LOC141679500 [Apium graveolens]|uniref:uncharacterized protein LOC141679500 n=1 Tax=Apium graveolens TaxID=4045 RepID=UPI003D79E11A